VPEKKKKHTLAVIFFNKQGVHFYDRLMCYQMHHIISQNSTQRLFVKIAPDVIFVDWTLKDDETTLLTRGKCFKRTV